MQASGWKEKEERSGAPFTAENGVRVLRSTVILTGGEAGEKGSWRGGEDVGCFVVGGEWAPPVIWGVRFAC